MAWQWQRRWQQWWVTVMITTVQTDSAAQAGMLTVAMMVKTPTFPTSYHIEKNDPIPCSSFLHADCGVDGEDTYFSKS